MSSAANGADMRWWTVLKTLSIVVEVSPHQPNPQNRSTADEKLRNVNFPHCYIQKKGVVQSIHRAADAFTLTGSILRLPAVALHPYEAAAYPVAYWKLFDLISFVIGPDKRKWSASVYRGWPSSSPASRSPFERMWPRKCCFTPRRRRPSIAILE